MVSIVEVRTPAPQPVWLDVLSSDPTATVTQTPDWFACISRVGHYRDASRLYLFDDGRRVVLPLARRRYLPRCLAVERSWPFDWGFGAPIADGPIDARHADAVYANLLAQYPLGLTVRSGYLTASAWHAVPPPFRSTDHTSHVLDLADGFAALWRNRFRGRVRTAVRKAERSALTVEVGTTGRLLDAFDALYRRSVDRWAARQHEPVLLARWRARRANPPAKIPAVARQLGDRCAVWVAWYHGEPAAAIVVLRHAGHVRYWRGAMNKDLAGPTCANDLLQRLAIENACDTGAHYYHMGESRPGSDLAAFKAGFGATQHTWRTHHAERLPLSTMDNLVRLVTKRLLGFRDA